MARYIDIDKYKKFGCDKFGYDKFFGDCLLIKKDFSCIDCYYSDGGKEDVAPVVHAKWEHKDGIYGVVYCSNCGYELKTNGTKFCCECGAKMDKE